MGILNLTPDSFSDGGMYEDSDHTLSRVHELITQGARVIDVGAESTRPHASPLSSEQEWQRLSPHLPEIIRIVHNAGGIVSLDTRHAYTTARAINLGIDWINDVSGGASLELIREVAQASHVRYVMMHSLSIPADPHHILPEDAPVRTIVEDFFISRLEWLATQGIDASRVILDVGLGFGKNKAQSLELLWDIPYFKRFDCPLLVGHSRKSMFSLCALDQGEHDSLTLLASSYLTYHQIDFLRVHNVARHATLSTELSTWAVNNR